MSNREFTAQRTMLANAFATAGAELLEYMGTSAALAAIPSAEPPRYVVAGTLAEIVKLMPAAEVIRPPLSAAEKPTGDLPPLPEPWIRNLDAPEGSRDYFATDQMRDYARAAIAAYLARQAQQAKRTTGGTSEQQARYAIDGAIQYGRENRNPPPSTDHWLYEYWNIGQQLRRLGETGWDNVTPLAAPASQEGAHAALDEVRNQALEEAALAAEKVQDEYRESQSGKWPELRDDAATGAGDCVEAIRALKTPASAEKGGA